MGSESLSAAFGGGGDQPPAQSIFKNRNDEQAAFDEGFDAHFERVCSGNFSPDDVDAPRNNVLTFYGVGGIGKTTLSLELERRIQLGTDYVSAHWPTARERPGPIAAARLDLSHAAGLDLEEAVLLLRLAVVDVLDRAPAFDLAFARYWAAAHPTDDLAAYIRRKTFASKVADAMKLSDQVSSGISELASALGESTTAVKVGKQVLTLIGKGVRDRRRRLRLLDECPRLIDVLEADTSPDSLSYYPNLLAWDIWQAQRSPKPPSLAVFIDGFEDIDPRGTRQLERQIQRIPWLMPNAFFVVTGRNRLDWDDDRLIGLLDHVGEAAWPGLASAATAEPRQHLIGRLSRADAQSYLDERLSFGDQTPEAEVVEQIVERADGWPLYLDLAVTHFKSVSRARNPTVSDFEVGFEALLRRVFQDLSPPERDVLRAATLLPSWSTALAAAGAGDKTTEAATRLARRALVEDLGHEPFRYRLHDSVRATIRSADENSQDGWSPIDWQRAAERTLVELGQLSSTQDRDILLRCIEYGLSLSHDANLPLNWLSSALDLYVSDNRWERLRPNLDHDRSPERSAAEATVEVLELLAERQRQPRNKIVPKLEAIRDEGLLGDQGTALASYYISEMHRDLGDHARSQQELDDVINNPATSDRARGLAQTGMWHLMKRRGEFATVLVEAAAYEPREPFAERTLGDAHWMQGNFEAAAEHYALGRDLALARDQLGGAAEAEVCRSFALAWLGGDEAQTAISSAAELMLSTRIRWAELQLELATSLHALDRTGFRGTSETNRRARDSGFISSQIYCFLIDAYSAAITSDAAQFSASVDQLQRLIVGREFGWALEIVRWWADEIAAEGPTSGSQQPVLWSDGEDQTRQRWLSVLGRE